MAPDAGLSDAPASPRVTGDSASVRLEKESGGIAHSDQASQKSSGVTASAGAESFGIYVFHSRSILGSEKPTESELTLLKKALSLATAHLSGPVVTLDADGQSLLTAPVVIYTKPQWDITSAVRDQFDRLRNTETKENRSLDKVSEAVSATMAR